MYGVSSDYSLTSYWQQGSWCAGKTGNGHMQRHGNHGGHSAEHMQGHGKKHQQAGADGLASKLFNDLDVDGSKSLSLEETGLDEETFAGMDSDQDSALSLAELGSALEKQRAAERAQKAQAVLASIMGIGSGTPVADPVADDEDDLVAGSEDEETDGLAATEDENAEGLAASAAASESEEAEEVAASDDDETAEEAAAEEIAEAAKEAGEVGISGLTSKQLFAALMGNTNKLADRLLEDLDTDDSKNLSQEESGLDKNTFDSMDRDKDGVVSAKELASALKQQRKTLRESIAEKAGEETATETVRGHRGRGRGMYMRAFHGYGMQMGNHGHHSGHHHHGFSKAV